MLKYLKPPIIPITFILFFFGNIITFLIVWGLLGFLAFEFAPDQVAVILMIACVLPAFLVTKVFYSSILPMWVFYSIKKTTNLHFLKYFLVQSKIVSKRILENKQLIKDLSIHSIKDEFVDDETVGYETIIKKSYADLTSILFATVVISIMMYQSNPENRIFAIVIFVVGLLIGIREMRKLKNQTFTFKLSNDGVWINENDLIKWNQIKSDIKGNNNQSDFIKRDRRHWYFTFRYNDLNKKINEYSVEFNQLNINDGRLNYLIYVYKNRYIKKEKSTANL